MPALNIRFTDDELKALRHRAEAVGRPMTALAHDVLVETTARANHDAIVMDSAARVIGLSQDLLKRLADR
jgi:hypothetical protein